MNPQLPVDPAQTAEGACLVWPWAKSPDGYPVWSAGRRRYGTQFAHRSLWIEVHGPIPVGYEVDHVCFNPSCVLIGHLQLLTVRENRQRRRTWLMHKNTCPQGHPYDEVNTRIEYRADGRAYWRCKACSRAAQARWEARHREQRIEYFRRYRARRKEAARRG
jgi:HNH endonuclease